MYVWLLLENENRNKRKERREPMSPSETPQNAQPNSRWKHPLENSAKDRNYMQTSYYPQLPDVLHFIRLTLNQIN